MTVNTYIGGHRCRRHNTFSFVDDYYIRMYIVQKKRFDETQPTCLLLFDAASCRDIKITQRSVRIKTDLFSRLSI